MDANRLDSLARTLATHGHRRMLVRALSAGALGLVAWLKSDEIEPVAARNCKKIKNKARRKKCRKKAKQGQTLPGCVPACGGATCGDDGCGGSCGACGGSSSCIEGICTCPSPQEFCGGTCMLPCEATQARNPISCRCCTRYGESSVICDDATNVSGDCCSGFCDDGRTCRGKVPGAPCQFDAQCASDNCRDFGPQVGTCT